MVALSGLALALIAACAHPIAQEPSMIAQTEPAPAPAPQPASIGEATMEPDGTIVLRLRAIAPDAIGEAFLRYKPDDPKYQSIREHLPALKPGDRVPVPPFP